MRLTLPQTCLESYGRQAVTVSVVFRQINQHDRHPMVTKDVAKSEAGGPNGSYDHEGSFVVKIWQRPELTSTAWSLGFYVPSEAYLVLEDILAPVSNCYRALAPKVLFIYPGDGSAFCSL